MVRSHDDPRPSAYSDPKMPVSVLYLLFPNSLHGCTWETFKSLHRFTVTPSRSTFSRRVCNSNPSYDNRAAHLSHRFRLFANLHHERPSCPVQRTRALLYSLVFTAVLGSYLEVVFVRGMVSYSCGNFCWIVLVLFSFSRTWVSWRTMTGDRRLLMGRSTYGYLTLLLTGSESE